MLVTYVPKLAQAMDDEELALSMGRMSLADYTHLLDILACHIGTRPAVMDALWSHEDRSRRIALLEWMSHWNPLCRVQDVLRGLGDGDDSVRIAAAQVARLIVDSRLVPALATMLSESIPCRLAALAGRTSGSRCCPGGAHPNSGDHNPSRLAFVRVSSQPRLVRPQSGYQSR